LIGDLPVVTIPPVFPGFPSAAANRAAEKTISIHSLMIRRSFNGREEGCQEIFGIRPVPLWYRIAKQMPEVSLPMPLEKGKRQLGKPP
jgi:hypothetical protein